MKTIITLLVSVILGFGAVNANTQYKVQGNNIVAVATDSAKNKTAPVKTKFVYTDTKGVKHEVFRGPKGGYFFLNAKGKKQYLPKEVSEQLRKQDKSK